MNIKGAKNREEKNHTKLTGNSEIRPIPRPIKVFFPSPRGMSCSENFRYAAKNAISGDPKTATR